MANKKKVVPKKLSNKSVKIPPKKKNNKKRGRPTKFKKSMIEHAKKLAMLGHTVEEIAEFIGIDKRTLFRYMERHPEFCHALKKGREIADQKVGYSLYERACGIQFEEEHYERQMTGDKKKQERMVLVKKIKKFIPPDVGAAIFWKTNREPHLWKNTQKISFVGEIKNKLSMRSLKVSLEDYRKANGNPGS